MRHYRKPRGRIYRSRDGMILGVCKGLAEHFDFSVKVVRIAAVVLMLFTGFWPVVIGYLVAAYFMKPEPLIPMEPAYESATGNSYAESKAMALSRLKNKFEELNHRVQNMETEVTDREFTWEERLKEDKK